MHYLFLLLTLNTHAAIDIPITQETFHCQMRWTCKENSTLNGTLHNKEVLNTYKGLYNSEQCHRDLAQQLTELKMALKKQSLCSEVTDSLYTEETIQEESLLLDCDPEPKKQEGLGDNLCYNLARLRRCFNAPVSDKTTLALDLGYITESHNQISRPLYYQFFRKRYALSKNIAAEAVLIQDEICKLQPSKLENLTAILPEQVDLYRTRLKLSLRLLRTVAEYSQKRLQWKGELSPSSCVPFINPSEASR